MFGSAILDVAIGIVFIYVVLSMMCSALREAIEGWLKTRAAFLDRGIRELLADVRGDGLTAALYKHPLINSLFFGSYPEARVAEKPHFFSRGHGLPSYIPSRNFALALLDVAARGPGDSPAVATPPTSIQCLRASLSGITNIPVRDALTTAIDTAGNDFGQAVRNVEAWYDSVMDRVSGKYKRASQSILLLLGFALAVGFNINTLALADYLYTNPSHRAALVAQAEASAKTASAPAEDFATLRREIDDMHLPIGWDDRASGTDSVPHGAAATLWRNAVAPLLGWLLTAFAVTLGAPFWFDVLNKVMMLRSTLKPSPTDNTTCLPTTLAQAPTARGDADEGDTDGCDAACVDPTRDDQLPAAQGGVA